MSSNTLLVAIAIGLALVALYKWITRNKYYWADRNVKSLKPKFLVGNIFAMLTSQISMYDYVSYLYNSFPKEKLMGLFQFTTPMLVIRDPELIKQLTIRDFDHFQDHLPFVDERSDRLFGSSLFIMSGEKWRDMRPTLSPAFTGSKMRQMFDLVGDAAYDMAAYFKQKTDNGEVVNAEVKELFSKYTNDVIATAAFGIKVNSFENDKNEFYLAGSRVLNLTGVKGFVKFILAAFAPRLMQLLNIQFFDATSTGFFKSMVLDTMAARTKGKIYRPDMINILMQVRKGATIGGDHKKDESGDGFATVAESSVGIRTVKREWTDDELVAQCFVFFVAGFDSSSTAISFTAYELMRNQDIQQRLYEECVETNRQLNGGKLTYDALQNMRYMDQVITEALRMWPPSAQTDRICTKDFKYEDGDCSFTITKGMNFWVPIYALHHDAAYFPQPERFDPERFNEENKGNIVQGSYLPFGIGPRSCIGSRFALMEIKAIIYYLMLNFKFVPNKESQIPLKLMKSNILKTERGIHMELQPRNV